MTELDNLPDLEANYATTDDQRANFHCDGHVLLRGVCTPEEIAIYRKVIVDAAEKLKSELRPLAERDTYGKAFLQMMNLWEIDAKAKKFVFAKRFARIAAELLGVESVRLYHDQALFKEAGGGHTPWHQDQYYWPLATDATVTMWMPLVDATTAMGTMRFASGSHANGFLGHMEISDKSDEVFETFVRERGFHMSGCGDMQAGDASFHTGWTLHSAPGNSTNTIREAMTIIYYADGALIGPIDNKNRQNDLDRWLPGMTEGQLAASPLNPVLWP